MITCVFEDGRKTSLRHVVVHAIVENKGKLLLVKRAGNILESGKWAIVSGFLDRNETAQHGIVREVKEETGWECEVVNLFRVNTSPVRSNDRERQSVAIEFILKPVRKVGVPDHESSKVEWIPIKKLISLDEFAFDHGDSIKLYLEYRKNKFSLPLLV